MKTRMKGFLAGTVICLVLASQAWAENYCNHPLLPILAGARWEYATDWQDEGGYSAAVQSVLTRGTTSYATLNLLLGFLGGSPLPVPLTCNSTEGIKLVELNSLSLPLPGGAVMKLQLKELSGVILPPMTAIQSGTPWTFVMDFDAVLTSEKGRAFNVSLRMQITSKLRNIVPVVVPAGSFTDAHLIDQDVTVVMAFGERFSVPKKFKGTRAWYLAPRVGQVAVDLEGTRTELVRYSIPVTTQ